MKKLVPSGGMITFRLFLFCTFILNTTEMFAQSTQDYCATEENSDPVPPGVYSYSTDPAYLETLEPAVISIYFWRIDANDGIPHQWAVTENLALKAVQSLNIVFNPSGIIFKYRGLGNFSSPPVVIGRKYDPSCGDCDNFPFDPANPCDTEFVNIDEDGYQFLSQCQTSEMSTYAEQNGAYMTDAMNVYVAAALTDFGGKASISSPRIFISTEGLDNPIFLHEMGHGLKLDHTFSGWNGNSCEQVTHDPLDLCVQGHPEIPCFNSDYAGDEVTDTAAMPNFIREHCDVPNAPPGADCSLTGGDRFKYYDKLNCLYIGTQAPFDRKDCKETPYEISPIDARNYMGYNGSGCSNTFTVGQGIHMKEALEFYSVLQPIKTTIESLYEPYSGSYPTYHPHPLPWEDPLFQPGFDYNFVTCDCDCQEPLPLPYDNTFFTYTHTLLNIAKEETDFSIITHPNHTAIRIDFPFDLPDDYGQSTRRCYDNYYTPPVIGGSVIKFNDGVFNANVTIIVQDSSAINNPSLIDELDPGLYNIQKTIIDGSSEEQLILKENN